MLIYLVLYVLLSLSVVLFGSSQVISADENNELQFGKIYRYGDLYYEYEKDGLSIISCNIDVTNVVIPNTINGIKVVKIASVAFANCYNMKIVSIPKEVVSIDPLAFVGCNENLVISATKNSYAMKYAKENNIKIQEIDTKLEIINFKSKVLYSNQSISKIKFGVSANGEGRLKYRFVVLDRNGKNLYTRGYNKFNYCTWTCKKAGVYKVYAKVKDALGQETKKVLVL